MKYQKLGKTDISISRICMGCWAIVGDKVWGPQKDSDSIRALNTAIDVGINFFDTVDIYGYGENERLLGEAVKEFREKVVIATKCGIIRKLDDPSARGVTTHC